MRKTILLADDSITIRKVVELTFADTDIHVEAVGTGREALERLDLLRPDLVLADVVMPEPTGYEVCRAVKGSGRPVPVLLLAGTFEPFDLERARDAGADGHLTKPFESRTLVDCVVSLLADAERRAAATRAPSGAPDVLDEVWGDDDAPASAVRWPAPAQPEALEGLLDEAEAGRPAAATHEIATPPGGPASGEDRPFAAADPAGGGLSEADLERLARAVVSRLAEDVVREIAWEVVPETAERLVRERLRQLEREEPA